MNIFNSTVDPRPFQQAINNIKPSMGWSTWDTYGCDKLNDKVVKSAALQVQNLGLQDAGYKIITVDDCW